MFWMLPWLLTTGPNEMPYKSSFVITECFTNGMVMLQCSAIKITHNIRHIKPYKTNTKVEYFNPKIWMMLSIYEGPVIYFYMKLKLGMKYMIRLTRKHLTLIHIFHISKVFMTKSFLNNWMHLWRIRVRLGKGYSQS